jgi:hypothetical protein
MRLRVSLTALLSAFVFTPTSAMASLVGSDVTFTGDYPILGTPISTTSAPFTVPAVFSSADITALPGFALAPLTIDVNATTIVMTFGSTLTLPGASFNGYVLDFTGAPTITGVSFDPASTEPTSEFTIGSTANTITISGESSLDVGATLIDGDTIVLDVATASPSVVPEPGTGTLLLVGACLLGLGGTAAKRNFLFVKKRR